MQLFGPILLRNFPLKKSDFLGIFKNFNRVLLYQFYNNTCLTVTFPVYIFSSYFDTMKGKCDPFRKMKISNIQTALQSWAKDKRFILDVSSAAMKARDKKVVTKTFHKAGLVVPFNKKTEVGYRELPERDGEC
jgi:hypothetical protein